MESCWLNSCMQLTLAALDHTNEVSSNSSVLWELLMSYKVEDTEQILNPLVVRDALLDVWAFLDGQPIGVMQGDSVFTSSQTSLSDQRLKTDVSAFDSSFLLDFCNSLPPSMYSRIDLTPQPRLGLIAQDVEASLETHALPKSTFINKLYQSIEKDGDIEELMGLDYARLSVSLLGR